MVKIALIEFLFELKKLFRGWNLIIFLTLTIFCILIREDGIKVGILYFGIWSSYTLKPKVNKLQYLLSKDEKGRVAYILSKSFGIFLFNIVWYGLTMSLIVVLWKKPIDIIAKQIVCEGIPILITYISLNMYGGYNVRIFQQGMHNKRNGIKYVFSMILMIVIYTYSTLVGILNLERWHMEATIIAYLLTFLVLYWQITLLKETDLSYENIRKVEKLFN